MILLHRRRHPGREWVRSLLRSRETLGEYHHLVRDMCLDNGFQYFRVTRQRGKGRRLRHGGARAAFPWPELLRSKSELYDPGPRTWLRSVADVELSPPRRNPILTRRSTAAMSLRRSSHHFASTMLSTMLLMAAVASWGLVTANPRPNDVFGTTIDEQPPKHQGSLADQKPLSSGTSQRDACSLDDYLATLTLSDMEKVIERYAKLQGMTVSGLIKQLYSSLYSSIKRKVVTNEVGSKTSF
ncbi:hypothetical protein ISCGN_008961 [Ixodes scapularis]